MRRIEYQCTHIKKCKKKNCIHYPIHSKKSDCDEECDTCRDAQCEIKEQRQSYYKR